MSIKVIFNGQPIDVEENTTLQAFIGEHGAFGSKYLVSGQAVAPETVLGSYSVVEESEVGTAVNETLSVTIIDIDLSDFTGRSGITRVANSVDAIRELYNQDVRISVIRDGQTIETTTLLTGDKALVTPAGGVKGA